MTTSDLTKCTKGGNGVALEGLSKLEQELCTVLWRVEIIGKKGLRKHVATVCQILNLKDNELDVIVKFMGHDIRTHREYYLLPEQTLQLAKVSKVLFSIENGNLQSMSVKSLDDIQMSPDEEVPVDESIVDDSQKPSATTDDSDVTDVEDNSEHLGSEAISPAENSGVDNMSKAISPAENSGVDNKSKVGAGRKILKKLYRTTI
ncbi:hypothetical protein HOLleu_45141 [Holothuria leucospilota]|uniref:Uncharacterized protein n=1 Tax=Holothuria leucospilota TaxID=206669 RepID=A0A9Q0YF10_HOLLE|nr:hypothetical protein HOLleu_45141 [Holothuria leucospilota]